MEIPYTFTARPDTGLYNGKLGIWLFLASEVMLFGAIFTAYLFVRLGADDGTWPNHVQNVWLGFSNTVILITSSITMVWAWVSFSASRPRNITTSTSTLDSSSKKRRWRNTSRNCKRWAPITAW